MLTDHQNWIFEKKRPYNVITFLFIFRLILLTLAAMAFWPEHIFISVLLILLIFVALVAHYRDPKLLAICHLSASALWGGFASILFINKEYGFMACFLVMIILETALGTIRLQKVSKR